MARKPNFRPHRRRDEPMQVHVGAYELRMRGAVRFDWRDPYYLALAAKWRWFLAALALLNISLNAIFALLYVVRPGDIANARPGNIADAFFFSVETLATVGYGVMAPATIYGHVVSTVEIMCGMAFTALATGLTFVRFSRPKAKIICADKIVVTQHHGRRTLMIRLGNGRLEPLTDAVVRVSVLIAEYSTEGQYFRRVHDLALMRDRLAVFPLTWTVMHVIDHDSPLYGVGADRMIAEDVRLFVSIEARDPSLAAVVHETFAFKGADVLFGTRYGDAVSIDAQGRTVADLTRISLLEVEETALETAGSLARDDRTPATTTAIAEEPGAGNSSPLPQADAAGSRSDSPTGEHAVSFGRIGPAARLP